MSKIQLRQAYKDLVYNYKPTWIIRWRITLFFITLLIIIITCGFIKFPSIIPAKVTITALNPPANVISKESNRIDSVLAYEDQLVNKDDNLVMFESNIKYNDIQKAKVIISKLNISITDSTSNIIQISSIIDYDLDLGDMQTLYSDLISSYIQYYQFYTNNTFEINILALKKKRKQEEENLQLYIAKKIY